MGVNYNFIKLAEGTENNKNIKLVPTKNYAFPVSDVVNFDPSLGEAELSFMGLTGVDSPLPHDFNQNPYLNNIINSINHKLYILYYRAVKKPFCHSQNPDFNYINSIINASFRDSRENLYKNLQHYLGENIRFTVTEFVLSWISSHKNQALIGKNNLGEVVLGERILSQINKIMIKIGPVLFSQAVAYRIDSGLKEIIADSIGLSQKNILKFEIVTSCEDRVVIGQWILH